MPNIPITLSTIDISGLRFSTDADVKHTPLVLPCSGTCPLSAAIGVVMMRSSTSTTKK